MKADRRLYYNADRSALVEEDDTAAAYLAYSEGKDVGRGDVERFELEEDRFGRVVYAGLELPELELEDSDRNPLPAEIPHREKLEAAGLDLDGLYATEDLTSIHGIGAKSAEAIEAFLEDYDPEWEEGGDPDGGGDEGE